MKHKFLAISILAALAMGMTACDDNDDDSQGKNTGKNAVTCRPRCDGSVLVTCGDNGKEVRESCVYGCDSSFNRCFAESKDPCDHEGVACVKNDLVTCINGVVANRRDCGVLGCDSSRNECVRRACFDNWTKCSDDGRSTLFCANNDWHAGSACKNGCYDGECIPDEVICVDKQTTCIDNSVATCVDNEWKPSLACDYGCANGHCLDLGKMKGKSCDASTFPEACLGDDVYYCSQGVVTVLECGSDDLACGLVDGIADCFDDVCENEGDNTIRCVEANGTNYAVLFTCYGLDDGTNRYYHNGYEIYTACSGACTDGVGCDGMVTIGGNEGDACLAAMYTNTCSSAQTALICDEDYGEVYQGSCSGSRLCAIDPDTDEIGCYDKCDAPSKGISCYYSGDSVYAVQSECKAGSDGNLYNFLDFDHYDACEYSCSEKGDKPGCGGKLVDDQGSSCELSYKASCSADGKILAYCAYDNYEEAGVVNAVSCPDKLGDGYVCGVVGGNGDCYKPCDASEVGTKRIDQCYPDYAAETYEVCRAADDGSGYFWVSVSEAHYCLSACNADATACIPDSEAKISVCSADMLAQCKDGTYAYNSCVEMYIAFLMAFGYTYEEAKNDIIEGGYCDDEKSDGNDTCIAIDGVDKACADYCDAVGPITKCEWDDNYDVYTTWNSECIAGADGKNVIISRGYEDCIGGCSADGTRCMNEEELKTWCDPKTYEESCDGKIVKYCSDNTITDLDCGDGFVCALDGGIADCYPDAECKEGDTAFYCSEDSESGASYTLAYTCVKLEDGSLRYSPYASGTVDYMACTASCINGTGCEGMVTSGGDVYDPCMPGYYAESCNADGKSGLYCDSYDIDWNTWSYIYGVLEFSCKDGLSCAVDPDDDVANCYEPCSEDEGKSTVCATSSGKSFAVNTICKKAKDGNYYRFYDDSTEDYYELCDYGCGDGKCLKLEDTVSTQCTSSYPGYCGDDDDTIYFCHSSGVVQASKCSVAYGENYSCVIVSDYYGDYSTCMEKCSADELGKRRGEYCSSSNYSDYEECQTDGKSYYWVEAYTRCPAGCDSATGKCSLTNAESVGTVCDLSSYKNSCGTKKDGDADSLYFCAKVSSSAPNATVLKTDCKKAFGDNYTCSSASGAAECVETCDPATYVGATTCDGKWTYTTKICNASGLVDSETAECMNHCNADNTGCDKYGSVADVCADGINKCSDDNSAIQNCAKEYTEPCSGGTVCDDSAGDAQCVPAKCDPATFVEQTSCTNGWEYYILRCGSDGYVEAEEHECIWYCADDTQCDENGFD